MVQRWYQLDTMVKMVIQVPSCECAPLCTCSMVEIVLEELSSLFEHQ